jgi:hypothetical protein
MKTAQHNETAEALARQMNLNTPDDVEIATREILLLADVILAIARHETTGGDLGVVAE